jgi:dipeptidyl aminopeptidase/acylaminoacyl peptidase
MSENSVEPHFASLHDVPLIPRRALFGNPLRTGARISPDGRYMAWSAPDEGVMNLWVAPRDNLAACRLLTHDRGRGVNMAWWSRDSRFLIYQQDHGGDENFHLYAISPDGGAVRDLTPFDGVRAELVGMSFRPGLRGTLLVELNHRDPRYADLYTLDVASGELQMIQENPGFAGFIVDQDYQVRLAAEPLDDGGTRYLKPQGHGWQPWLHIGAQDARSTQPLHLDACGETLYLYDSRGRDTAALVALPLAAESGDALSPRVLAEDSRADIGGVLTDQLTLEPLAYSLEYQRTRFVVLDERLRRDVALLDRELPGEWQVTSRSEDDRYWSVSVSADQLPGAVYLYDRQAGSLQRIYVTRPGLLELPLARMQSSVLRTRDGWDLVAYLTLPVHADEPTDDCRSRFPLPLVLLVHGGPWARDSYGYDPIHQWLANRGYAVLCVNFRGSTGFGKRFVAAGDGEWGARMDDDLNDAVDWAIERGIADPSRVAIMGASYGGYATLWAMTQHPERYACGVDIVGPSNLYTLLDSIPPYWESFRATLYQALGDPSTAPGRQLLEARSPLRHAGRITKPLLIGQGRNDPRVKESESKQMIEALRDKGIPYTYVLFPDEGHGFARPANDILFNIVTEQFLAAHLGGRQEVPGNDEVLGSSAIIERG